MTGEAGAPQDFVRIFGEPLAGELPAIVGGKAVNLWETLYYGRLEAELAPLLPFTSKDLDLLGSVSVLKAVRGLKASLRKG